MSSIGQALALFRYGLIAEFTHLPAGSPGLYARLREKANADYVIPGTTRSRVAPETLRHWLKDYRRGGFEALLPKGRADTRPLACAAPGGGRCAHELEGRAAGALDPAVDPRGT